MDDPLLTFKPNLVNALVPAYFKNLVVFSFVGVVIYALLYFSSLFGLLSITVINSVVPLVGGVIVVSFLPLSWDWIRLYNTEYLVFDEYVVRDFEFMVERRYSAQFDQVVNLKLVVNMWDKMTGCGSILMFTADDDKNDLSLDHVKNPREVQKKIQKLMHDSLGE